VGQNRALCKAVPATFSVLKLSWAIFWSRNPKVGFQLFLLYSFHCKPRPSRVRLQFLELENIVHILGNQPKDGQNHGTREPVSANFGVLN